MQALEWLRYAATILLIANAPSLRCEVTGRCVSLSRRVTVKPVETSTLCACLSRSFRGPVALFCAAAFAGIGWDGEALWRRLPRRVTGRELAGRGRDSGKPCA